MSGIGCRPESGTLPASKPLRRTVTAPPADYSDDGHRSFVVEVRFSLLADLMRGDSDRLDEAIANEVAATGRSLEFLIRDHVRVWLEEHPA